MTSFRLFLTILLAAVSISSITQEAMAWGKTGHRVVGKIAEDNLTRRAKRKVRQLIGAESLAEASIWADWVKSEPDRRFQSPWHYTSVADGKFYEGPMNPEKGDIVTAINEMVSIIQGKSEHPRITKAQALKMLVHLVGDIHQPIHVGRSIDRGGNLILVKFFKKVVRLHALWDEDIVTFNELSYTEISESLQRRFKKGRWVKSDVVEWANESIKLRPLVYLFTPKHIDTSKGIDLISHEELIEKYPGAWARNYEDVNLIDPLKFKDAPVLTYQYVYRTLPVVEKRLYQGGMRLARLLNEIL